MKLLNFFRTIRAEFLLRWYFRDEDYEIVDKSGPTSGRLNPVKVVIRNRSDKEEKYEFAHSGTNAILLNNLNNLSLKDLRPLIKLARRMKCNLVETKEIERKLEKYPRPFKGEIELYDYVIGKPLFVEIEVSD